MGTTRSPESTKEGPSKAVYIAGLQSLAIFGFRRNNDHAAYATRLQKSIRNWPCQAVWDASPRPFADPLADCARTLSRAHTDQR